MRKTMSLIVIAAFLAANPVIARPAFAEASSSAAPAPPEDEVVAGAPAADETPHDAPVGRLCDSNDFPSACPENGFVNGLRMLTNEMIANTRNLVSNIRAALFQRP